MHNEWYPVERDLPMDLRTRDYVLINGALLPARAVVGRVGAAPLPCVITGFLTWGLQVMCAGVGRA